MLFRSSTNKPAILVELKYGKPVETALQQIRDRQYTQALEGYTGEILLVGISYNREDKEKPHSCVIERKDFYTGKVPKNAVKWAFFGTFWCLGGV